MKLERVPVSQLKNNIYMEQNTASCCGSEGERHTGGDSKNVHLSKRPGLRRAGSSA